MVHYLRQDWAHTYRIIEGRLEPAYPDCFIALSDITPPKQMPENIPKLSAWWLLVDVAGL